MALLELVSGAVFAALAGLVAGVDAARRGQSWPVSALGVGATAFAATVGVLAADGVLLAAYAAVNGGPLVAVTPLELLGLTVVAAAAVSAVVLAGYGALVRRRGPA